MIIHPHCLQFIEPDWPAPGNIKAVVSTRNGSLSNPPFDGFNTADHVGDDPDSVARCRQVFQQRFAITHPPQWLEQVHGVDVIEAQPDNSVPIADASYSRSPGQVCTLHTADCLPVFFCDTEGSHVALTHAGWRGLADGILENTLATFTSSPQNILCWLGPAISQSNFEVGHEVKARFEQSQNVPKDAFIPSGRVSESGEHFLCDLYALARARLADKGVHQVFGGEFCTYQDSRFFSYRRDSKTGRILSAVWIQPSF